MIVKRVFLGGTCNESKWRDEMEAHLKSNGLGYFNPVVDDWNEEAQANELREREECDFCLYVITPYMTGVYSIAEVVDDSNKRPDKTFFILLKEDGDSVFRDGQWRSLVNVAKMVARNGGTVGYNLKIAAYNMSQEALKQSDKAKGKE